MSAPDPTEVERAREGLERSHAEHKAACARLDDATTSLESAKEGEADTRRRLQFAQACLPSGGRAAETTWSKLRAEGAVHAAKIEACEAALARPRAEVKATARAWAAATAFLNELVAAGLEAEFAAILEEHEARIREASKLARDAQALRERYAATIGRQLPIVPVALHLLRTQRDRDAIFGSAS